MAAEFAVVAAEKEKHPHSLLGTAARRVNKQKEKWDILQMEGRHIAVVDMVPKVKRKAQLKEQQEQAQRAERPVKLWKQMNLLNQKDKRDKARSNMRIITKG